MKQKSKDKKRKTSKKNKNQIDDKLNISSDEYNYDAVEALDKIQQKRKTKSKKQTRKTKGSQILKTNICAPPRKRLKPIAARMLWSLLSSFEKCTFYR